MTYSLQETKRQRTTNSDSKNMIVYGKDGKVVDPRKAYGQSIEDRGTDVKLKELLEVENAFETESPLP